VTHIVVEIGCDPGSKTCGTCNHEIDMPSGSFCEIYDLRLPRAPDDCNRILRLTACLDAEEEAIPKRSCGCPVDGPFCYCENDE
jgi:hypothetical protein